MNKKITVFGCNASRNILNYQNTYPKELFEIGDYAFHTTIISIMHNPLIYNEKLINTQDNQTGSFVQELIKKDLNKSFLNNLKNNDYDYLILDTYFDVKYGVIKLNDEHTYITNSNIIHQTELFKQLKNKKIISIKNNPIEFIDLWIKSCDDFFKYISNTCPNMKVILNPIHISTNDCNNPHNIQNQFYQNLLNEFILNKYNVNTFFYDKEHAIDENLLFDVNEIDNPSYFKNIIKQFNLIQNNNETLTSDALSQIKSLKRKLVISQFNEEIAENGMEFIPNLIENLNNESSDNRSAKEILNSSMIENGNKLLKTGYNKHYKLLNKFMTARVDIKNYGNENNDIDIVYSSNPKCKILKPNWFKNNEGSGFTVQDDSGYLNLKLRCLNKGKLVIKLRSIELFDNYGNKLPIYVDYTSFKINDKEYVQNNLLTCSEKAYPISKNVEDNEIVDIKMKWMPLNSSRIIMPEEPKNVIYLDKGITKEHEDIWILGNTTLFRTEEYSEIKRINTTNPLTRINIPPEDIVIELDLYQNGSRITNYFVQFNQDGYLNGTSLHDINGTLNTWVPIQITIKNNETFIVKNMEKGTTKIVQMNPYNHSQDIQFCFWNGEDDMILRFKNFRVYKI